MESEERPETTTVEVEQTERGWMVVHVIDGERKPIEPPHSDRESAESVATTHRQASDRWTGAADVRSPSERPEARKVEEP